MSPGWRRVIGDTYVRYDGQVWYAMRGDAGGRRRQFSRHAAMHDAEEWCRRKAGEATASKG